MPMTKTEPLKLVTIIVEDIIREKICESAINLGATGYSCVEVKGDGSRGARHGSMPGQNVQIEFVCTAAVADKILTNVSRTYFENYACIAWTTDIAVMHGEQFIKK